MFGQVGRVDDVLNSIAQQNDWEVKTEDWRKHDPNCQTWRKGVLVLPSYLIKLYEVRTGLSHLMMRIFMFGTECSTTQQCHRIIQWESSICVNSWPWRFSSLNDGASYTKSCPSCSEQNKRNRWLSAGHLWCRHQLGEHDGHDFVYVLVRVDPRTSGLNCMHSNQVPVVLL